MKLKFAVLFLMLFIVNMNWAQHISFWSKIDVIHPLYRNLKMDWDLQYRRQNASDEYLPFTRPLQISIRPWFTYQRKNINLSFLPISFIQLNRLILNSTDMNRPSTNELRTAIALDWNLNRTDTLIGLTNRFCLESRNFLQSTQDVLRFRYKIQGQFRLSKPLNLLFYNELFVNLLGISSSSIFDNNRTGCLLRYTVKKYSLDFGYQYVLRNVKNYPKIIQENCILLNVKFNLVKP